MARHTKERRTPAFLSLALPLHNEDKVVSGLRRRLAAVIPVLPLHGLSFIFTGAIGGNLSRIIDRSKGSPRDIIAEAINADDSLNSL